MPPVRGQNQVGTEFRFSSNLGSVEKVQKLWSQSTGVLQVSFWVWFLPSPQIIFLEIWKTWHHKR